ncbi:hypothetical protein D9M70_569540 [compost metagenome]
MQVEVDALGAVEQAQQAGRQRQHRRQEIEQVVQRQAPHGGRGEVRAQRHGLGGHQRDQDEDRKEMQEGQDGVGQHGFSFALRRPARVALARGKYFSGD